MFGHIYDLLISFVTVILGFFGFDLKKKTVTFSEDTKKAEEAEEADGEKEEEADDTATEQVATAEAV
jgi:hypothetical protein